MNLLRDTCGIAGRNSLQRRGSGISSPPSPPGTSRLSTRHARSKGIKRGVGVMRKAALEALPPRDLNSLAGVEVSVAWDRGCMPPWELRVGLAVCDGLTGGFSRHAACRTTCRPRGRRRPTTWQQGNRSWQRSAWSKCRPRGPRAHAAGRGGRGASNSQSTYRPRVRRAPTSAVVPRAPASVPGPPHVFWAETGGGGGCDLLREWGLQPEPPSALPSAAGVMGGPLLALPGGLLGLKPLISPPKPRMETLTTHPRSDPSLNSTPQALNVLKMFGVEDKPKTECDQFLMLSKMKENNPATDLIYSINDRPPWYLCVMLALQHYILAFGGIIAIPLILAEPLCVQHDNNVKSQLISTIFFVSGICTLLQTTVGTRLPILQGGTFSLITPTLAILSLPQWKCQDFEKRILNGTENNFTADTESWQRRMREIQGAVIVASTLQLILGFSGLIGLLLKFIGPLSITPTITLIGLSLFNQAGKKCGAHWGIAAITITLIIIFSQYLRNVEVPILTYNNKKWKIIKYPVFKLFPVLLGMCLSWLICYILTYFNALPRSPMSYGYAARTDINSGAIANSPWFHVPYPGQWGFPTISLSSVLGMMSGILSSTIESVGDYYTCARLSGAPLPPTHALNRGIGMEGIGCIIAGIWGTGNGTTSYSQNIAALGITKVGSRLVLQIAGFLLLLLGLFGKFGAIFITIPEPVIGGMFMVMFGMIAAVGISNLQYVDLNSSRNLFVLGFSLFSGLVIPTWLENHPGAINTGIKELDQTLTVLLTTHMFVGGFIGCFLDNTVPGSDEERGTSAWYKQLHVDETNGSIGQSCYDLPYVTKYLRRLSWSRYIPFLPTFQMQRN
ncbi:solute carrier family 23 member 1-like [Pelodytes ibericus]